MNSSSEWVGRGVVYVLVVVDCPGKGNTLEAIITADGTNCRALASTLQYMTTSKTF